MANHCTNYIEISGPPKLIKELYTKYGLEKFELDKVMPKPVEIRKFSSSPKIASLEEYQKQHAEWLFKGRKDYKLKVITEELNTHLQEKYDATNWYAWANIAWGTKGFKEYKNQYDEENGIMVVEGDSDWRPPDLLLQRLSERYPEIETKVWYMETGMDFMGCQRTAEGIVIEDHSDNVCDTFNEEDYPHLWVFYDTIDDDNKYCNASISDVVEFYNI